MTLKVTFLPDGQSISAQPRAVLLKAIQAGGRPIGYSCRGQGICVACAVWVSGICNAVGHGERDLLAKLPEAHERDGFHRRIACLARAESDVIITTDYW